jgi:alpha-D-ribose 1-methylphosphonate 5-phosphate C-P lyase
VIDDADGRRAYFCSDTAYCEKVSRRGGARGADGPGEGTA